MSDPSIKKRNKKRRKKAKGASGEAGAADSQPNGQEKVPKVSYKGSERVYLIHSSLNYQTILINWWLFHEVTFTGNLDTLQQSIMNHLGVISRRVQNFR